jgi:hypothetical protein
MDDGNPFIFVLNLLPFGITAKQSTVQVCLQRVASELSVRLIRMQRSMLGCHRATVRLYQHDCYDLIWTNMLRLVTEAVLLAVQKRTNGEIRGDR